MHHRDRTAHWDMSPAARRYVTQSATLRWAYAAEAARIRAERRRERIAAIVTTILLAGIPSALFLAATN